MINEACTEGHPINSLEIDDMSKINFNILMYGLLLIAIGFMMLKTWPEPDVFEPVQPIDLDAALAAVILLKREECIGVASNYGQLYEVLLAIPSRLSQDPDILESYETLMSSYEVYSRLCSDHDALRKPIYPPHLTI